MRLAVVSPLPPQRSGVSDYSALLLRYLRPHFESVVVVADGFEPELEPGLVDAVFRSPEFLTAWRDCSTVPLYHVGCNTRFHGRILSLLRKAPGFVVLHDGNLLPMVHELTVGAGNMAGFLREAAIERSGEGLDSGWRALWGGESLRPIDYAMIGRIARSSLGVIVHSQYLADRVGSVAPGARVAVIPHLDLMDENTEAVSPAASRASLGVHPSHVVIGAVGLVAPVKQIDLLLAAFSRLAANFPLARVVCVGEFAPGYQIGQLAREHGIQDRVTVTGHTPAATFARYLSTLDIGVNLRHPTWGETSGALVRLMSCGVPTIVADAGAYAELPDRAVVKVPSGRAGLIEIERALRDLLSSPALRAQIGAAARSYVKSVCDPKSVAALYASFIQDTVAQGARQVYAGMSAYGEAAWA